jgi:DNA-directed RNA polymerase subunit beta'
MKAVKERNPMARSALLEIMKNRPVQMNRAPSLHKLSIMGFSPTLVSGHAIHINPSIVVPFTADFDGDQVNIHAPVSDQAVRDTKERMFPERNLIAMSNRKILYRPEKEYTQGLYAATRFTGDPRTPKYVFNTLDEARAARRSGIIEISDPIKIKQLDTVRR